MQLKKSRQTCYVMHGKEFSIGGQCVMLHLEVTLNCNSVTSEKNLMFLQHFYVCVDVLSKV
jgi:hypothetical protein